MNLGGKYPLEGSKWDRAGGVSNTYHWRGGPTVAERSIQSDRRRRRLLFWRHFRLRVTDSSCAQSLAIVSFSKCQHFFCDGSSLPIRMQRLSLGDGNQTNVRNAYICIAVCCWSGRSAGVYDDVSPIIGLALFYFMLVS
ncbi:hypothetical protein TNCV_3913051 [Trichonephila clavipes]|nr:hypothetical protein TNCV_3913051 [Trichonephila clavipes]